MKPKKVKKMLQKRIKAIADSRERYVSDPLRDFTRERKLPLEKVLSGILGMGAKNLSNEVLEMCDFAYDSPTVSAFVQQRCKLNESAFEDLFKGFSDDLISSLSIPEYLTLAVDGSDIQIPLNSEDTDSYFHENGIHRPYNILHLNALYALEQRIYTDAVIQKGHKRNEAQAFVQMIDRSPIEKALVIADRGYESYNSMAHIQEKGWKFLIRVRESNNSCILSGFDLPEFETYDVEFHLNLTRRQTKETKELFKEKNRYRFIPTSTPFDYLPTGRRKKDPIEFYELHLRVVRFRIAKDLYEVVLTNLGRDRYPEEKIRQLYALRWGIETSFRDLKYTTGMLHFHSKKVMCSYQEIYAHLTMYNFAEMVTSHVIIKEKNRKYIYKANFTVAANVCRRFFLNKITSPKLEAAIERNTVPIRPDRQRKREKRIPTFVSFVYRIA